MKRFGYKSGQNETKSKVVCYHIIVCSLSLYSSFYHLHIDWYCFQMSPPLLNIVREKILVTTFLQYVPAWYARRLFKVVKTGTLSRLFCDSTHHGNSSALLLQSNIGVYTLGIYLYSDYTENTNFNRITKTSVCHVKE